MAILNDYGDAGVYKVEQAAQALAAQLGIQKEVIYGFFNDHGRFPATLDELVQWGNTPDRIYGQRRRQPNGVWTPIMPGPTPGKTDQERGGFNHVIANAEDSQIQRFKEFDPSVLSNPSPTIQRSASVDVNSPAYQQANPPGQPFDPTNQNPAGQTPQSTGGAVSAAGALPGAADRTALVDANAYGNTETLRANIDKALRDYALARTQEQRNQAYLDLQRWQEELRQVEGQQKSVTDMATAILSAATTLGSRPQDIVKFNQTVSGGRDILDQISGHGGPVAAFGGPTGQIQPGSVWDLLGRLGMQYPQTPATPAGVLPGAANPVNPDLPAVTVPGTPQNPGALGEGSPGGSTAPAAAATGLPPSYEQALRELDQAAGGQWSGNRTDRNAVAQAWWAADPTRRGRAMPAVAWG